MKKLELNQMENLQGGTQVVYHPPQEGGGGGGIDCGIGLAGLALGIVGAAFIVTTGGAGLFAATFILGSLGTARAY
ncbi:hypothetical protein JI750_07130 [Flavobacterium sp. GN10]|uniref:Bacteriocin n=1 Tax=Flavobacterium tagetis TaxID=2801336 RepID=A0ABS1KAX2_9FLAO|nr:hypothetical protein [Flavobacterium tagetis]MBL0736649.1 hypothetical protein [Flavobacterium tagetis]